MEIGNPMTRHEFIKSFTKETNLFDLNFFDGETVRLFEDNCCRIETHYPRLISSIERDGKLTDKYTELLTHYLPSLLCRSVPFRKWVEQLILHDETRLKFFREITMFMDDEEEKGLLISLKKSLDVTFQINFVMFYVMQHFLKVLPSFNFVLLKDFDCGGWCTTDNPVVFDKNNHYEWTIPLESEFYLPLTPAYCLFLYHPKFDGNNNLRKLEHQSLNNIDEQTHQRVTEKISYNLIKYLIFPSDVGRTNLEE